MAAKPPVQKAKKTAKTTTKKRVSLVAPKKNVTKNVTKKPAVRKTTTKKTASKTTRKTSTKKSAIVNQLSKPTTRSIRRKGAGTELVPQSIDKRSSDRSVALEQLFKKPTESELSLPEIQKTDSAGFNIKLPTRMSLRSIAKAQAIANLLNDKAVERVRRVAYVASFGFIIIGGFYALNGTGLFSGNLAAALPMSMNTSDSTTESIPLKEVFARPNFTVKTDIPAEINTQFNGEFTITDTAKVEIRLQKDGAIKPLLLNVERAEGDIFKYSIPGATLDPGLYTLRVASWGKGDLGQYLFTLGNFEIPEIIDQTDPLATATSSASSTIENVEERDPTQRPPETEKIVDQLASTSSKAKNIENDIEAFDIYLSQSIFTEATTVYMTAPKEASDIEIYLRPESSYNNLFVTSAERVFNTWRFTFDISNVPSGQYELFARGTYQGLQVESKPKTIKIEQPVISVAQNLDIAPVADLENDTQSTTTTEQIETTNSPDRASVIPPREFSELSLAPAPQEAKNDEPEKITTELLRKRKDNLEVLLRNYSAAVQAGDTTMVRLATEALDGEIIAISNEEEITSNIEKNVVNRVASLRSRIDTFEELRKNANDGITALDTDQDGISDFDETALYQTDPKNPDSDADGVLDGVEIMRGFDPINTNNEAVLAYESPKDVIGLERADVLSVNEVTPVVETDESLGKPRVQSRISGVALPNSYVTLYIFSTPTIINVKTDDTGAFVYMFEKELTDGAHEVYVAITDNTGGVIAHSEPFAFVKEAEAFSVSTDVVAGPVTDSSEGNQTPYAVALGLGVLALGLVLLMLGIGLRAPVRDEINQEATA